MLILIALILEIFAAIIQFTNYKLAISFLWLTIVIMWLAIFQLKKTIKIL